MGLVVVGVGLEGIGKGNVGAGLGDVGKGVSYLTGGVSGSGSEEFMAVGAIPERWNRRHGVCARLARKGEEVGVEVKDGSWRGGRTCGFGGWLRLE